MPATLISAISCYYWEWNNFKISYIKLLWDEKWQEMIYTFSRQIQKNCRYWKLPPDWSFIMEKLKNTTFLVVFQVTLISFWMQFITATTSLSQCYLSLGNCLKLSNLRGSHLTDLSHKPPTHQDKGFGLLMYSLDLLQEHTLHWFLWAEGYRFCGAHGHPIATQVRNTVQRSTWPLKAKAIEKYTRKLICKMG